MAAAQCASLAEHGGAAFAGSSVLLTFRHSRSSLMTLQQAGIATAGLSSKGNDAFEGNLPDIVITVCDKAANESCPAYFGPALKSHWGLEDPSDVKGDEETIDAAFRATLARIEQRCRAFFELPLDSLSPEALKSELDRIGKEAARLLEYFGAETRLFDPSGLPLPDDAPADHPKVQELRNLTLWSEGQVWCSPERHGAMSAVFKAQIDWIPLELGALRPTQGKTLAVMQVCGGSQSFNVVNQLRVLGRWMRMFTIPNQSSVPKAYMEFDEAGRMKSSAYYDRVVDVMEELVKFTVLLRDRQAFLVDRYSERKETAEQLMARTYPYLVAIRDGRVVGCAYASQHRARAAYRWAVDVTVYISEGERRTGVGCALYEALLPILVRQGFHAAYAGIAQPNPGSVALHERLGFRHIGTYPNVGFKRGQWHDVGYWHLELGPTTAAPAEICPFPELANADSYPSAAIAPVSARSAAAHKSGVRSGRIDCAPIPSAR
nr:phosphinothricin acetyltransferase [Tanacetum cinerariifolium]